jgi:hypothetical protein
MGALYITNGRREIEPGLPDQGNDMLKTDALNALPGPLLALLLGGDEYEIIDIEPEIATARINVCGLSQVVEFVEITRLTDIEGGEHDPDDFWHE